jgi:hypothetical protein
MIQRLLTEDTYGSRERTIGQYLAAKYSDPGVTEIESRQRCEDIVAAFATLNVAKHGFLAGNSLSALDLGWAAFAALIQPLPNDVCPMDPVWRDLYTWTPTKTAPVQVFYCPSVPALVSAACS